MAGLVTRSVDVMSPDEGAEVGFERLVAQALDELPPEIAAAMENVEVVVEDEPPQELLAHLPEGRTLFGHYHGVPLTRRWDYDRALPDKISIYRGPIERNARTVDAIKMQVRITVIHEIGHHFGLDEGTLRELGWH